MMKNYKFKLRTALAVVLCILSSGVFAQLPMTRSTFTSTFTPITVGSGAIASTIAGDDGTQLAVPIGFTFNYLGNNFTTMDLCSNGWASFGAAGANAWTNANLFTATAPNNTLAPWWDDLNVGTGAVLYQTEGTPGSQTFTVQWTNVLSYNGGARNITFKLVLFEGTNVIEFHYDTNIVGAFNAAESASIGIEGATGGPGNFIDATSGSSFINQSYNNTLKWVNNFIRFTPGAPAVMASGTYTVGASGNFSNLTEAVANINHRGISGPVTLSLTDALYDTTVAGGKNIFPVMLGPVAGNSSVNTITIQSALSSSTLSYRGVNNGNGGNQGSPTVFTATSEPILALVGTDYVTVKNLNLQTTANGLVDRAILIANNSATDGAQNNVIENISATLLRTNTSSIAIQQVVASTPTAATGANSNNTFRNFSISNSYTGVFLSGNAAFPDLSCVIGNTSPTTFNLIGGATAGDLGGGTATPYGIRCTNQSGVQVYNNEIRNMALNGAATCDGIFMELTQGNSDVYRNKIHDLRNNSTTATNNVQGIRANVATTGTHNLRVYNNFIYGLTSAYAGAAVATRQFKGIYAQSGGGGVTTSSISIDNNSVYIDGSASPNVSSTCFEIGTASGPVINVRNNIFSNNTGAQTAPASHYTWVSTSATLTGNTGSVSNNNDMYIANATQGFVGLGNAAPYATLANWQAAMVGQDANSISSDPSFTSSSDLHVNSVSLNGTASPLAWITSDIDNQVRSVTTPDIGADEFSPALLDAGVSALVAPVSGGCFSNAQQVTVQLKNYGVAPLDFSTNNVAITVNVTGAITTTLNITLTDNTINAGSPLAVGGTISVPVGTINMSTAGTYTFNSFAALTGDANGANDAMSAVNISYQPGSVLVTAPSVCQGSPVTLTLTGNTSSTIQWEMSTDGGATWGPIAGATTTPFVHTPTDTTVYRSVMCGTLISTNVDTVIYNPVFAPTTTNDTVCGIGSVTLGASGVGTLNWYAAPTGGSIINTGTSYTTTVSANTTYYVESVNGGTVSSVGLVNNTAGGGQQTSTNYNTIDVFQSCTLLGAYVYPGAAGNVVCELLDNTGALITSRTVAVSAGDVNQRTFISLNIPLTPGTGYRLAQGVGSVSLFRNSAGVAYPYTIPGTLSITGSAAGATFYYWFYDLQVSTGCASPRVPVDAIVVPAASISAVASAPTICAGDSTSLTVNSTNAGYAYTWTPTTTLSDSVGNAISAFPLNTTSYIVTADSAGCIAKDTVVVSVNPLPVEIITASDSIICQGQNDTLIASIAALSGAPIVSSVVPVSIIDNTTASSTISIPVSSVINPNMNMQVCFDITHTWDSDMNITLTSPFGTVLDLTSGNGGGGDNYTATCFNMAAATNITLGAAPFTGTFVPEGAGGFNVFDGENALGTWTLSISDVAGGDQGSLNSWSISFTSNNQLSWTSNPVGFTSTSSNIVVSPTVTTDYILTLTDTITGCTNSYTQTVYVRQPLAVTLTADSIICLGNSSFISAAATGGDGNYGYNWSNGVTTAVDTVSPVVSTQYTLTLTDGCGSPAVVDSFTVDVATPLVITGISNDSTVCANAPLVLNIATSGGDGNNTYAWSNGATTSSDSISTAVAGSVTTYSITVTDGCASTVSDSVVVTTYGLTTASILTADTTVCSGTTVIAVLSAGGGDGNLTYNWSNGVTTANDTTVSTSTTTYIVSVADGCANIAVDSITVSIYSPLSLTVSNDTTICYGDSVNLAANVSGGDGNYNYAWSNGVNSPTNLVGPALTTPYGITVNDGCSSISDSVQITVNQYAIVNLGADTTQCAGTIVLDADNTGASFLWNDNSTAQTLTVSASGQYSVAVTQSGCTTNDTIDVTINPLPLVGLNPFTSAICNNLTSYTLTGGNPAGGVYSGPTVTGTTFNPSVAGIGVHPITYTVTDTNGCSNSSTQNLTVQSCSGIEEYASYEVLVYPNPSSGEFTLSIKNANIEELIISVVDIQGKEVFGVRERNITADYNKVINLENVSKGMYYIKLSTGSDMKIQKLIVQ